MTAASHARLRYSWLLLGTMGLGLIVRFVAWHVLWALSKYGGSALWAIAIFWLMSVLTPRASALVRAAASLLLAFAVEFFKLVRTPALDAFRLTLPGKLLLGRFFSFRDLLAYAAGIAAAAALDHSLWTKPAKPVR